MKRIIGGLCLALLLAMWLPSGTRAQNPDPADLVFANLVTAGYDVIEVGVPRDAQGNPMPDSVYVQMQTITLNYDDDYIISQVVQGLRALAKYYPHTRNRFVVLQKDNWLLLFNTTAADWDDLNAKRITGATWWKQVRNGLRFYDRTQQKCITAKDFT